MVEDIGKIITNGFGTYTRNLNICIPFILNFLLTFLSLLLIIISGFAVIFGPALLNLDNASNPEEIISKFLPLINQHIIELAGLLITILIAVFLIQSYFTAGSIGMAIQAAGSGRSSILEMRNTGRKNLMNMFLAEILFGLLSLAGIIFIVPGAMRVHTSQLFTSENKGDISLLLFGFMLWVVYLVILGIIFSLFRYALVADNLGPIESMTASLSFFKRYKGDVISLFLFILLVGLFFVIIDQIMSSIPVINKIWDFISLFISLIIIPPLTTIWWVRLYMDRTGRKLYIDDLLAHPNDLK